MRSKSKRGGARKGAGRPKTKEDTVVVRVPKSLVQIVKDLIDSYESNSLQRTE